MGTRTLWGCRLIGRIWRSATASGQTMVANRRVEHKWKWQQQVVRRGAEGDGGTGRSFTEVEVSWGNGTPGTSSRGPSSSSSSSVSQSTLLQPPRRSMSVCTRRPPCRAETNARSLNFLLPPSTGRGTRTNTNSGLETETLPYIPQVGMDLRT